MTSLREGVKKKLLKSGNLGFDRFFTVFLRLPSGKG